MTNCGYIVLRPCTALLYEGEEAYGYVFLSLTPEGEEGLAELREFVSERDATV